MILKEFYQLKKTKIASEVSYNGISPKVFLYNNEVFRTTSTPITNPFIMFKYDMIDWETSSERTYKADVNFCVYVVMPKTDNLGTVADYQDVFDIAQSIDKAVLFEASNTAFIDTNSTFKVTEKQLAYDKDDWAMTDYFIWEITYKTTLIESNLKKRYHLIKNGFTNETLTERGYAPLTADVVENDGSVTSEGKYFSIKDQEVKGELYFNYRNANEESIIKDNDLDNDELVDVTNTENDEIDLIGDQVKDVNKSNTENKELIEEREIKKTTLNNNQA